MEIKIKVDNINYESILKVLMPLLSENKGDSEKKIASKFIAMFGKGTLATKMISLIPQDAKDNMVMHFVNDQKDFIISIIKEKLGELGIEVQINDIEITKD